MLDRRGLQALGISLVAMLSQAPVVWGANVYAEEAIAAIRRAGVLPPGAKIAAQMFSDRGLVSTYRNPYATPKDLKIEAIIIAKSIMDLAPGQITKVTIYFYSTQDFSQYKEVGITTGDVRAYGSGEVSQAELLSSIDISDGELKDPVARISNSVESYRSWRPSRPVETSITGDQAQVKLDIDSDWQEEECKLEALKVAQKTFAAAGGIKKVQVLLIDPSQAGTLRQIVVAPDVMQTVDAQLDKVLAALPMSSVKASTAPAGAGAHNDVSEEDIYNMELVPGPMQDERQALFMRLKSLKGAGVGIDPFLTAFLRIEDMAKAKDEEHIAEAIKSLADHLTAQEKLTEEAKNFHPKGFKGGGTSRRTTLPSAASRPNFMKGTPAEIENAVLANPEGLLAKYQAELKGGENHPNYPHLLEYFAQVMRSHNRFDLASKYSERAQELRAKMAPPVEASNKGGNTNKPPVTEKTTPPEGE